MKAIIIPGNGGGCPEDNWSPYLAEELPKQLGIEVVNVQFPDAVLARKEYWLPFLEELGAGEDTILIGHSSGAVAAMRYAETHKLLGSVLVGGCYTDLGYAEEKASGYYDDPWDWEAIRRNQEWIVEFASTDDPFIPIAEARHIAENLKSDYREYTDRGHFGHGASPQKEFPEVIEAIRGKLQPS